MEKQSNLSAGEWKLMKQLWARGPATVKELTGALREETLYGACYLQMNHSLE